MASSIPRTISRRALQELHGSYVRAAGSFGTYNFREYFLRIADRKFGEELSSALGESSGSLKAKFQFPSASSLNASLASGSSSPSTSSSSSPPPSEDDADILASLPEEQRARLQEWWDRSTKDLDSWKRSSIVNNLYQAPRLVVEGEGNITVSGGGGAGMEASPGGAGQPVEPEVGGHGEKL